MSNLFSINIETKGSVSKIKLFNMKAKQIKKLREQIIYMNRQRKHRSL